MGKLAEDYGLRCVAISLMHLSIHFQRRRVGDLFLKRLLCAIPQAQQSRGDFNNFDISLRQEIPQYVLKTENNLAAWTKDKSCPDPYRVPKSSE